MVLSNFTLHFNIECDGSGKVVVAALMQNKHFIAFDNQALKGRALRMLTYEKKCLP